MFKLHFYGLFIGLGILLGAWVTEEIRKKRLNRKIYSTSIWQIFWWVTIPALIGARLYHVIDFWQYYSVNPDKILATWEGGMGIYGGIIGGIIGLGIFSLSRAESRDKFLMIEFLKMADLAGIGLPLGQAVGRLGNFVNQELYGLPTRLPWGIYIPLEKRLAGYQSWERFHPLFAYEAIWNLLVFAIILYIINKKLVARPGTIFFLYLGLYGLGRFFLDFLRINPWQWGSLTVGQWLSLTAVLISLAFLVKKKLGCRCFNI